MHLLATIDVLEKRETHLVKDESGSEGTVVHIDASNFAIGCVLTQPGEQKLDHPIYFASHQLNEA